MITLTKKKQLAFTMLELVFVIVVLGILAALAMPRMDRDLRQEAADNILSAIRYTQHLAINDDKHQFDVPDWQKSLWQIRFNNYSGNWVYSIWSNLNLNNNVNLNEAALDPQDGKRLDSSDNNIGTNESPNIFLTRKYNINSVVFNRCSGAFNSNASHIAFDNLGRPHRGVTQGAQNNYRTYVSNGNCTITFTSPDFNTFIIQINQETGYAQIVDQNAS